jgi:hypothetical protein
MIDSRPEAVEHGLFSELRSAGTIDCLVGVESGVDRLLKLYSKGATVERNIRAIETLRDLGISLNLGFIMFDPRMTMSELKQNLAFLRSMDILTVDSLRSWLWPLFGTPVVEQLRVANLITSESLGEISYRFMDPEVQSVYDIVFECAHRSRAVDRALFKLRKAPLSHVQPLAHALARHLDLWARIFDRALKDPAGFDFLWLDAEVSQLLHLLSAAEVTPPAQQGIPL